MSDYISPLVKIISSIISVKSAISFIFIGIGLLSSWVYIKPYLDIYEIPDDIKNISLTSIGIGGGIIASRLLYSLIDFIHYLFKKMKVKKEKKLSEKAEYEKTEHEKSELINFVISNIKYFNNMQLHVLYELNNEKQVYTRGSNEYDAAIDLSKNSMVYKVSSIDSDRWLLKINPNIQPFLTEFFFKKHKKEVEELARNLPRRFIDILPYFILKKGDMPEIKKIPNTLSLKSFLPFIKRGDRMIEERYYATFYFIYDYKLHFENTFKTQFVDSFTYIHSDNYD